MSGLEWGVIHKVLSAIRQPARRVQTLKYMTGWLATMKVTRQGEGTVRHLRIVLDKCSGDR